MAELVLLRIIGTVWSTSDFSHPVVAPAVLLMGQYLSQARIRRVSDVAAGLFLVSILAQVSPVVGAVVVRLLILAVRVRLQANHP